MAAEAASKLQRPALPRKFGRYALFDYIGKGGMAEIFLARAATELGGARLCVVKQILPELAQRERFAEMLIHEAKLAARLSHANIVQVFDLGRADDRLFIAMDYVEGFDLNDLLRRCTRAKAPLPFEFALLIVCDVLRGLDYAHRRTDDEGRPLGIVHRDVSPSNLLVSFEGEVKVCDFGIARANDVSLDRSAPTSDAIEGKAGYMSPEHARGDAIDARADIFAMGIVLWELCAGRRMYRVEPGGPSLLDVAVRAEIPELPPRGLPAESTLYSIVNTALSRDRDGRHASAQAMLRALEEYMREAKLVPSPLKFGEWLVATFGTEIVAQRRARERAVSALEHGVPVTLTPIPPRDAEVSDSQSAKRALQISASTESASALSARRPIRPSDPAPPISSSNAPPRSSEPMPRTSHTAPDPSPEYHPIERPPESIAAATLDLVSVPSSRGDLPAPAAASSVKYVVIAAVAIVVALVVLVFVFATR